MEKVSHSQLVTLIIMIQVGSSPLFLLGKEAGTDSWIAILIAMVVGLLLLLLTFHIHRLEPDKDLIEICNAYVGKYIGYLIAIAYFVYFSYQSVRNIRELGDLINLYLLPNTPLYVLIGCIVLIAGYTVWHGIEVFGRITQIILPIIILVLGVFIILIYNNNLIDLHRIEPILDNGWKKVIDASFPELVSFPFGEMVLFLMFWKFVTPQNKVFRKTVCCYASSGIFMALFNFIIVTVLGPISQMSVVPFIQMMSLVHFASFLERFDPIVMALLYFLVFIKLTAYYLGAAFVGKHLLKVDKRYIVITIGVVLFIGSLLFRSYIQHMRIGIMNLKYHFPIFQIYLPVLLLIVMLIRSRLRENGHKQS